MREKRGGKNNGDTVGKFFNGLTSPTSMHDAMWVTGSSSSS